MKEKLLLSRTWRDGPCTLLHHLPSQPSKKPVCKVFRRRSLARSSPACTRCHLPLWPWKSKVPMHFTAKLLKCRAIVVLGYNSHALPMVRRRVRARPFGVGVPMRLTAQELRGWAESHVPETPAHSLNQSSPLSSSSYGHVPEKSLESSGLARKCHTRKRERKETTKTTG